MSEQYDTRNENIDQAYVDAAETRARELEREFSQGDYKVVRKELFAHLRDPAVVIRYDSVTFNTACIDGLEDVVYINIMINEDLKRLAIRASDENDKNALRWCVTKPDKRKSRKIVGKPFSQMLYKLMGWNPFIKYKIMGYKVMIDGEKMYIFDLTVSEKTEERSPKMRAAIQKQLEQAGRTGQEGAAEGRSEEQPFSKDDLDTSFGLPLEESQEIQRTTSLEGYASYSEQEEPD